MRCSDRTLYSYYSCIFCKAKICKEFIEPYKNHISPNLASVEPSALQPSPPMPSIRLRPCETCGFLPRRLLRSAILTPCGQGLRPFRLHYAHSAPKSPRLTGGPQNDSGVRSAHNQSQPELPGTSHLPVFRPLVTASKFSSAQRTSSSRIGNRLCPNSVREYSTFGGISEYCRLRISPSISRAFNVSDRTFGDMSGIALAMVLKRVSLFSERTHRISTDHLPENRDRTFRTGQESISVYFRRFSLSSNLLIFNVSYL